MPASELATPYDDEPDFDSVTEHLVASATLGDWHVELTECIDNETDELLEQSWEAWRHDYSRPPRTPGRPHREEIWNDTLYLTVCDVLEHPAGKCVMTGNAHGVLAGLHKQAESYWAGRRGQ